MKLFLPLLTVVYSDDFESDGYDKLTYPVGTGKVISVSNFEMKYLRVV